MENGDGHRTFSVIDDFNREALAVEIGTGISAQRVVRILEQAAVWRGTPKRIRFDNGPELTALAVADWAPRKRSRTGVHKPRQTDAKQFHRTLQSLVSGSGFEYVYL